MTEGQVPAKTNKRLTAANNSVLFKEDSVEAPIFQDAVFFVSPLYIPVGHCFFLIIRTDSGGAKNDIGADFA